MRFMQKFAKTFKCCKIEVAGEATVHLANARRQLNDAIKKRDNFLNVFVNVETKLNKAIEVATLNQKENIEQTKQKVLKRKEEIEQARKDAGLPPKQENASNAMAAFVPPPPAAENAETAAGGKTDEEMQAAKKKVIELETANEVASKKEMEKTNRLAENLKEINDKLTKSKSQKENEIESVKQVVEDAEWDVEDAETHVDELKIEAQASKGRFNRFVDPNTAAVDMY
jgi:leucyl aminopeptidase